MLRRLRHCTAPVLFVRGPAGGAYRHVLAAVDDVADSLDVVRLGAGVQPEAQLELFHAIGRAVQLAGKRRG